MRICGSSEHHIWSLYSCDLWRHMIFHSQVHKSMVIWLLLLGALLLFSQSQKLQKHPRSNLTQHQTEKKKRKKKCLISSYRSSGIDLIVSSHSASQVGWCFQEEGGLTQCFMLVIHLFGKLGSGRALGTCPSMIFRRVSGMSGVFLVHAGEELRGRGPTLLQGCWYVLSGLHCPCNMVYKEVPVSVLPLHLCGSRMP